MAMDQSPDLAVIIVIWRSDDTGLELASSITGWTKPPMVIVVDNESLHPEKVFPFHYLPTTENTGFSGGNNMGLQYAIANNNSFALLLNPDTKITHDTAIKLVRFMRTTDSIFALSPLIIESTTEGRKQFVGGRNIVTYLNTRLEFDEVSESGEIVDVDYCIGACVLMRLSTIQDLQLFFDERFFLNGEMADICRRAQNAGFRTSSMVSVAIQHLRSHSTWPNPLKLYYNFRNRFLYIQKHDNKVNNKFIWWTRLFRQYCGFCITGKLKQARAVRKAAIDVLTGQFGNRNHHFI